MKTALATYTVRIWMDERDYYLNEAGWYRLRDGIEDADLPGILNDAAVNALADALPRDIMDVVSIEAREER